MITRIWHAALLVAVMPAFAAGQAAPHETAGGFPAADRPVAPVVSSRWSTEDARDHVDEAGQVMARSGIRPGMVVADIGAGDGYYTTRLARRVGQHGHVLAEDIDPQVRDALAARVTREQLANVRVQLGQPADPALPGRRLRPDRHDPYVS